MLPSAIIGGVIAAMVGVIGFAVTRQFVDGLDTSTWSAAERAIISDAVPVGIALVTFIIVFSGISSVRSRG